MLLGSNPQLVDWFRLVALCTLLINNYAVRVSGELPDHDEIRKLLVKDNNINYDLLRDHFDIHTGFKSAEIPQTRLFPLCINSLTLEGDSSLNHFAPILKEMDSQGGCETRPLHFYEYNASLHSTFHNKDWIESITLSRINTPEVDVRNMRQWMHITVKAKTPLRALYMQTVVGSMGLPSGEFSLEFPCSDIPGGITNDSMVVHCEFRSRAELNHPVAFFGGYAGAKQMTEFHVHYKWNDISCLETPFLQFMLIAIKDFRVGSAEGPEMGVDFQPLFSPVYTNIGFDSKDGAITPYYIDWKEEMTCTKTAQDLSWVTSNKLYHDTTFEALEWKESQLDRLFINEDYDECLSNDTNSERNVENMECSPGPFECPKDLSLKSVSDQEKFQKIIERRQAEFDQAAKMTGCSPCVFPPEAEVMNPFCISRTLRRRQVDPALYLDYSEFVGSSVDARYHGAIAIFVYIVLTPVGIFLARFYRGIPVQHVHKDDFWILVHGAIHLFGLHLLWVSVGFVTTMDEGIGHTAEHCYLEAEQIMRNSTLTSTLTQESYLEWLNSCTYNSRKYSHSGMGIFSMIIHNLNVVLSFFRSRSDYVRNIQVIVHSQLGYIDVIVSMLTIFFAVDGQHCSEILAYCIVMAIFTVLSFVIANYVTAAEDNSLGLEPSRYKWPILEPIRLAHAGPFYEAKMAILGIYAAVLLFVWILSVVSLSRVTGSEANALGRIDTEGGAVYGIFTSCRLPDLFKPAF